MAKYEMEIVTRKGNKFRDGGKTLIETRKKACRFAKNEDATVMIRKLEIFNKSKLPNGKPFSRWKEIEKIWYDPEPNVPGYYTNYYGGYWLQKYGPKGKRTRVSPKTGNLLDVSKEWKSI